MFGFKRKEEKIAGKAIHTIEEYLELDDCSEKTFELHNGSISEVNNTFGYFEECLINLTKTISEQINSKIYELFSNYPFKKTRVWFENEDYIFYPDFLIVDKQKTRFYKTRKDIIVNPLMIIEVSTIYSTTENPKKKDYSYLNDRTWKFQKYQSISSLKEYVLIADGGIETIVETYNRLDEKNWKYKSFSRHKSKIVTFESIGATFPMTDFHI